MKRSTKILYVFPPIKNRRVALFGHNNGISGPERYLLYGLDYMFHKGYEIHHNILSSKRLFGLIGKWFRHLITKFGGYGGDIDWFLPHIGKYLSSNCLFAFSDRSIFPVLYLRYFLFLKRIPTIYIAVGLPEKLRSFSSVYLKSVIISELNRVDKIVTLSKIEADILENEFDLTTNVVFIPAGVDKNYFQPMDENHIIDVLSIGADPNRDFDTLITAALHMKNSKFLIITSRTLSSQFRAIPHNVIVKNDIPMRDVKKYISKSKLVVLPVKNNSYSGGTTVMLQAMAMGKVVIANSVGANISGYGFVNGVNCLFFDSGDALGLSSIISNVLNESEKWNHIGIEARRHIVQNLTMDLFHERLELCISDAIFAGDKIQ